MTGRTTGRRTSGFPTSPCSCPARRAVNRDTFWYGGPDFAVEIVSKGDRSRKKLPFYAKVGTRELLIVDRKPWALELYRLDGEQMALVGRSTVEAPEPLASAVLPLSFRLSAGVVGARPEIEVRRNEGGDVWRI